MGLTEYQEKELYQKRNPGDKSTGASDREKSEHDKSEGKSNATATFNGEKVKGKVTPEVMRKHPPTLLPRIGSRDLHKMCGDDKEEEGPLKPYAEKKKPRFKWPVWIEDWEIGDTVGVVTVGIAVTALYVAYRALRAAPEQG